MSESTELEIRQAWERGDRPAAITALLDGYGAELLGYLAATLGDRSRAREVYSLLCEDLWRGLLGFEWRCTARAWSYTLARNARSRFLLEEGRFAARECALSQLSSLGGAIERTRTPTPLHRRSEVRSRLRDLRARLSEPEQTLLMLRVDRGMSWKELAVVLGESDGIDEIDTARAAARLRTRFQALKTKLRDLVRHEGIMPGAHNV